MNSRTDSKRHVSSHRMKVISQTSKETSSSSVDDTLWRTWDKGGQKIYHNRLKQLLVFKSTSTKQRLKNTENLVRAFHDIVCAGLKKILSREQLSAELKRLLAIDPPRVSSVFSDVWSTLDTASYCQGGGDGSSRQDLFLYLTHELGQQNFFFLFQEKMDAEFITETGLMSSAEVKTFNQKFIRLKTKAYYKQQKFNLFREEPEGYGKLLAEMARGIERTGPNFMLHVIRSLLGTSYLDPNRVLDVVLEGFECQPSCVDYYIPLISKLGLSSITICEILAFKVKDAESTRSLFNLIALLLYHSVINLDELYPWLKPDNRVIDRNWERQLNDSLHYASQAMRIRLDGKNPNGNIMDEDEYLVDERSTYADNHKILLCKALLDVGAWDVAKDVLERHPKYYFTSCPLIARSFVRLYNYIIEPIYNTISNISGRTKKKIWKPFFQTHRKKVRQVRDYDQMEESIDMLLYLGPYIHCDPVLMYKIMRVLKFYLEGVEDLNGSFVLKGKPKTGVYYSFLDLLDEVLLPAQCYMDGNCAIAKEIWSILEHYPYNYRFQLYGSWKSEEKARSHPTLIRKRVDLLKQVKHLMRRISKENVKTMGRQLGKLSHSIPSIVFDYILSQIQLFDNLIVPVIDALRYLSPLGYDLLGYCVLEALSPVDPQDRSPQELSVMLTADRPRTKHDGSTIAPWIQSLATFTGTICKKYSFDLVPMLQYVANQLKAKESLDLLLLKEIVQKMTGIEAAEDITSEQLEAMSGGELLKSEAGYFGQLRTAKKSATRLRDATGYSDLAITLCILMAQQRNRIVYDDSQVKTHTKLVGKLYDQCQDTLVQFGSFLASSCTLDEYTKKVPPIKVLLEDYHIDSDVAFFLWRPILSHLIMSRYEELRKSIKTHKKFSQSQTVQVFIDASTCILDPVIDVVKNYLPPKTWEDISPQFYVTFWSLTVYDLFIPNDAYAREISRVRQMSVACNENKEFSSSKRRKEQERYTQLIEKLEEEQRRQADHVKRVMTKLGKEKENWFAPRTQKSAKNEAVTAFLQHCIFPRCIYTSTDALYCAQFVNTVHLLSTPNFSTLICYDRIFCDIIYTVTSCTENEANRYGLFLNSLLNTVMKWHKDKAVFEKECATFPGFVTKFRAANTSVSDINDHVDYENYRHVCHKWHYKITKCIIACLESQHFSQIRNALIVLKRILPSFPRVTNLANAIEKWVERVRADQKDRRHDLFALATSYIGQLKAKLPSLIPEEVFHYKAVPEKTKDEVKLIKVVTEVRPSRSIPDIRVSPKPAETKVETKLELKTSPVSPEPMVIKHEDIPRPPRTSKLEEPKHQKSDGKTIRIRSSGFRTTPIKFEANGDEKPRGGRRLDLSHSPRDRETKKRRLDDKDMCASSTSPVTSDGPANKRHNPKSRT